MRDTAILIPVFVLAAWTGLLLVFVAGRRITAGVGPREFAFGESPKVPPAALLANRNYMNLLELPVLFYVVCLVAFVTQPATAAVLPLAWTYVALRIVHSLIHVSYNKVMHRFAAFALSNFVLLVLWVVVGLAIFARQGGA